MNTFKPFDVVQVITDLGGLSFTCSVWDGTDEEGYTLYFVNALGIGQCSIGRWYKDWLTKVTE